MVLAVILAVVTAITVVWALATALAGRFVGGEITEIMIFNGPRVRVGSLGSIPLYLGFVPIGSSVRFLDTELVEEEFLARVSNSQLAEPNCEEFGEFAQRYVGSRTLYEQLPLPTRLTVHLIGWIPCLLFAQVILGLPEALRECGEGFGQAISYLLEPDYAKQALASIAALLARGSGMEAAAIISMKVVALNLLPLPLFAGGQLLLQIGSSLTGRWLRWPRVFGNVTAALMLAAILAFLWNTAAYFVTYA